MSIDLLLILFLVIFLGVIMEFLERIKFLCKENKVSQGKMEADIGISNGASSKWKNSSPSMEVLVKLSAYFHVSLEYLITGQSQNLDHTNSKPYEFDSETTNLAMFLRENPEYKSLLDVSKNLKPADIPMVKELIERISKES